MNSMPNRDNKKELDVKDFHRFNPSFLTHRQQDLQRPVEYVVPGLVEAVPWPELQEDWNQVRAQGLHHALELKKPIDLKDTLLLPHPLHPSPASSPAMRISD